MDIRYEPVASSPKSAKKGPTVSVSSLFSQSPRSQAYTTKSRPKSWPWHFLSHFFSFLWLAPIIALLVLNFKQHVIGASVWCPFGKCASNVFEHNAVARAAKLDKADHNLLGALQFIAKALEVWFFFIATALLYDLAMILARHESGLPIGYILTHLEFGDIRNLLNPLLWTSPFPHAHASQSQKHRKSVSKLFIFGIIAAFLTILTNLMGPAAAVLVLPTLQWVSTPRNASQIYQGNGLGVSPSEDLALLRSCNASQLDAGNFSCTYADHGPSMDQWAATALLTTVQYEQHYGIPILGTSQESAVLFALNVTANGSLMWTPNRQVLQELSHDYLSLADPQNWGTGMTQMNDSLQVIINRQGPSIGFETACAVGNLSVTNVADDKQIHCFSGWTQDDVHNYTKCYRIGQGFHPDNRYSNFWIGNSRSAEVNATAIDVYFSDMATYYNSNEDFGSGIEHCLNNETAPACDWDSIFGTNLPNDLRNSSRNVGLVSYSLANDNDTASPMPGSEARIFCDVVAYVSFPTYALDTSPSSNILNLVRMDGLQMSGNDRPLVIHPDWFLAAWSVDRNGTVDSMREVAQHMSFTLPLAWVDPNSFAANAFSFLHVYSLGQTMSMINYAFDNATADSRSEDAKRPVLFAWATRHVWAYGINGSRTSKLGVAVVSCGAACVILRLLLGLLLGKREHSAVELIVAALEHHPTGEFSGMEEKSHVAKVRYVLEEDPLGKLRFVPERHYSGKVWQ
ncbi:MAG: hypothetical protein Q9217_004235 [Psora testacea]